MSGPPVQLRQEQDVGFVCLVSKHVRSLSTPNISTGERHPNPRCHRRVGSATAPLARLSANACVLAQGRARTHLAFTVVATDLRGYGASSKPEGGENHLNYSKRAMALDQLHVMHQLGFRRFSVAGHDRGGRVAHRLALDHPEAVERLAVLDIAPAATMYASTNRSFAEAYYHWFFLIQPFDLPERLIGASADYFLRWTLNAWCKVDGAITEEAFASYRQAFESPGAIHAACEDYRASATIDLEHDLVDDRAGRRLAIPVLALWGLKGTVGQEFDVWQVCVTSPRRKS